MGVGGKKFLYMQTVVYKGTEVAMKKIDKSKFNLNRSLLIELKTVSSDYIQKRPLDSHVCRSCPDAAMTKKPFKRLLDSLESAPLDLTHF